MLAGHGQRAALQGDRPVIIRRTLLSIFVFTTLISTGARAAPLFGRGVVGLPILSFTFENLPPETIITNEVISGPDVIERTTGGGVANADLFIPESNFSLAGLSGSASLDLQGPGSAFVSMSAVVRTTITTEVVPQSPPFAQRLAIGPTTSINLTDFTDAKASFGYRLAMTLFPDEENLTIFDQRDRHECVRTGERFCNTFFDFSQADAFFPFNPGRPTMFDTLLRYDASLESLAISVPEPPTLTLMLAALVLFGGRAIGGSRGLVRRGGVTGEGSPS
jgi:hypothetical protein